MKPIVATTLLLMQLYLTLNGVAFFGESFNPLMVFVAYLALPLFYIGTLLHPKLSHTIQASAKYMRLIGFGVGCLLIILTFAHLKGMFTEYVDPGKFSDVVPQIDALYTRFANGERPYRSIQRYTWFPYPVYMPMHWLPVSISYMLNIDVRWSGMFILVGASGVYGYYIWRHRYNSFLINIVCILLPSIPLWAYLLYARFDVAVTFEFIIVAYYLLLATGLATKNLYLTIIGIICCLLSRYTMVFWLPLFAILLWMNNGRKISLICWGAVAVSILGIYVIPFLLKDPRILINGLTYHNETAIAEWTGYGEPKVSPTFKQGLYFAPHFKEIFTGTMAERVFALRIVQALVMLSLTGGGLLMYRRLKGRINFYDFSLAALHVFILIFYVLSPILFKYYYLPLLIISAVICARIYLEQYGYTATNASGGEHKK